MNKKKNVENNFESKLTVYNIYMKLYNYQDGIYIEFDFFLKF